MGLTCWYNSFTWDTGYFRSLGYRTSTINSWAWNACEGHCVGSEFHHITVSLPVYRIPGWQGSSMDVIYSVSIPAADFQGSPSIPHQAVLGEQAYCQQAIRSTSSLSSDWCGNVLLCLKLCQTRERCSLWQWNCPFHSTTGPFAYCPCWFWYRKSREQSTLKEVTL